MHEKPEKISQNFVTESVRVHSFTLSVRKLSDVKIHLGFARNACRESFQKVKKALLTVRCLGVILVAGSVFEGRPVIV